ncbi:MULTISPECIES: LytTR family DNA-binding domain-containing protein [Cohnella]|jgi:DNA-binding LytR/AlgR family response regulator|uniref:LytTR family DNA-binding domain-containing protein n=1 Tax=Cohnella TaxID=329857 RepID=UPI0003797C99|nr:MULTISPECIES: LytTR family DNA-binding domain-containing protein [Cohnella]REK67499.1 MAG: LytTR family transcriptional regulator [Cohnella sp.]
MKWPVTRDEKGETGLLFISLSDIVKISAEGNRLLFHTKDEVFYQLNTLEKIESALKAAGLPFERADRGHLIDLHKVVEIDVKNAIAYFEPSPGKERKSATLSRAKLKELLPKMKERMKLRARD